MIDAVRADRRAASKAAVEAHAGTTIAVVGAGVAGTGVAYALREHDVAVTVFERGDGPGGRTATRRRGVCRYDIGANYVTPGDERVSKLVGELDDGDLVDVDAPVWTFDAEGTPEPGDPTRADDHKWTFTEGIQTLPRRLLERSNATLVANATVDALVPAGGADDDRWWLEIEDGERFGAVDGVVLTPPAPETAALLARSGIQRVELETLERAARSVAYRSIDSFALHYPFALERPYYALVNADKRHDVGWLAFEGAKRGHVPDDESLLIVQMAPDWSVANRETPLEAAADAAAEKAADLLDDERLAAPDWADRRRWPTALPGDDRDDSPTPEPAQLRALEPSGLYVAGDWVRGTGRVYAALASGFDVAERIRER